MQISEETIERIKNDNDIVDIISESVKLKRSGRNYMGLCPFHNEKTPSFSVSQDKQIYKCFSCGESGNVITFVMKQKSMNFVEALKYLADKVNITLKLGPSESSGKTKMKEMIYKANIEAARYFFKSLIDNKVSKNYFLNRGISENTVRHFGLGYANNTWSDLTNYLTKKGFKHDLLVEAGLILKSEKRGNYFDRFRNRVMFPVFDIKGRVIGFGGRVLDDSKPKYLNSPETIVFHKGTNLYGLNFAVKKQIQDRTIIIVEGYMDCISLHQYGITNAVASLGTALTQNQARLLKRYADNVVISYDADFAGQSATLRGIDILREAGFQVKILDIPQGKDPDEFLRMNGSAAFLKLVKSSIPIIEYRLKMISKEVNFNNQESLIKYLRKVSEVLKPLVSVEKDVYIKKIAQDTGIREEKLYDSLSEEKKLKNNDNVNNLEEFRTKLYVEPAYLKAEKSLLKLMIKDEYFQHVAEYISSDDFNLESHKKIFDLILKAKKQNSKNIFSLIESNCNDIESSKALVEIQEIRILQPDDIDKLIKDYIKIIKCYKLSHKLEVLKKEQKSLEQNGKIEESIKLVNKLNNLSNELKKWNDVKYTGNRRDF